MTTFTFSNINRVASLEASLSGLKDDRKEIGSVINRTKVEAYTLIVSDISSANLTAKGKLPQAVSRQLKDELTASGVSPANVKRYVENATGILRALPQLRMTSSPDTVASVFETEGLTTEAKIKARAFPPEADADLIKLAKTLAALSDEDREKVRAFEELEVKRLNEHLSAQTKAAVEVEIAIDVDEALEAVA
jgi:hypothetical protein